MPKPYLTAAEAGALLGIDPSQVRRLCGADLLPGAVRFGRAWAIPPAAVEHYKTHRAPSGWPKGRKRKE